MAWYLCTISRQEPENWERCKAAGLWGVPGVSKVVRKVKSGDRLLFWQGGRGYFGFGVAAGESRQPTRTSDVPWPGGLARWSHVIPIQIEIEVKEPIFYRFERSRQLETGFYNDRFQRGFAAIDDAPAQMIAERLRKRSDDERAADAAPTPSRH